MYQTEFNGTHHELGTSGFLYRSNKLMYDQATKSLWSTLMGKPVVGPLVGKGIRLNRIPVVTTSWAEWKQRNPDTTVLSIETGHRRDYGEGVAYREYFGNDQLMFTVPQSDRRLRNKDEVLALREGNQQLAISAEYLKGHPIFHDTIGRKAFVVLTGKSGGNRVYESGDVRFRSWDGDVTLVDGEGRKWTMTNEAIVAEDESLKRMPAHRAFWFGWHAQFPETRLVK